MDLSLTLDNTLAIITGATGQIGRILVTAFLAAGCQIGALDKNLPADLPSHPNLLYHQVDITSEPDMIRAFATISHHFNNRTPTICICAAGRDLSFLPACTNIIDLPVSEFRETIDVNVTGTFITAKTWLRGISDAMKGEPELKGTLRNVSCVIMGSEAGVLGVPGHADYAASKSAIQVGLVKSLAVDAVRVCPGARVNAVAPGAVDTEMFRGECAGEDGGEVFWREARATVVSGRPVGAESVARMCLVLASERWSGDVNGQVVRVDGGKSGRVVWGRDGEPVG